METPVCWKCWVGNKGEALAADPAELQEGLPDPLEFSSQRSLPEVLGMELLDLVFALLCFSFALVPFLPNSVSPFWHRNVYPVPLRVSSV